MIANVKLNTADCIMIKKLYLHAMNAEKCIALIARMTINLIESYTSKISSFTIIMKMLEKYSIRYKKRLYRLKNNKTYQELLKTI